MLPQKNFELLRSHHYYCLQLPYSGKLLREKTFTNFADLWLSAKVFYAKFGGVASFGVAYASYPQKFSPSKVSPLCCKSKKFLCKAWKVFLPTIVLSGQEALSLNLGNTAHKICNVYLLKKSLYM